MTLNDESAEAGVERRADDLEAEVQMMFRLRHPFSNFDRLRSKEVPPESKAFVSYLQEMMKVAEQNRAMAVRV